MATGFANGARLVTAAALMMFLVFFAFVPGGSGAVQAIALGLAAGVAFDAFPVRMSLVPAVEWTRTQQVSAISTESLFVDSEANAIGPIDLAVPAGGLVLAHGDVSDRRLVAATLAGRLYPVSGRAQVVGHSVPSESGAVSRLVAIADAGMIGREDSPITLGELFAEQQSLTQPRRNRPTRQLRARRG